MDYVELLLVALLSGEIIQKKCEATRKASVSTLNFPSDQQPILSEETMKDSSTGHVVYPLITREKLVPFSETLFFYRTPIRSNYSHFYFAQNYTARIEHQYKTNIRQAKAWLLSQRDSSYGWGKHTPEVLISLSLISNSFQSDVDQNELLKKSLQTHLEELIFGSLVYDVADFRKLDLIPFEYYYGLFFFTSENDGSIENMSTTRLAMYINALFATCQNPRDFKGLDLPMQLLFGFNVPGLNQKISPFRGNPLILLSQCLTGVSIDTEFLQTKFLDSSADGITKEDRILAVLALACQAQLSPANTALRSIVDVAALNLLKQMDPANGSFGSVYDTALATQVLMSVNTSLFWDYEKTLNYLAQQQKEDGSFGDLQSTCQALIALSGRSLLHIRNTLCYSSVEEKSLDDIMNREGPKKSILYTLRADYPASFSTSLRLSVPVDTNFYDIMRIAARQDPIFEFKYKIFNDQPEVHLIANIFNYPALRRFWNLYWLSSSEDMLDLNRRFTGDIRSLIPADGDELMFWYLYTGHN